MFALQQQNEFTLTDYEKYCLLQDLGLRLHSIGVLFSDNTEEVDLFVFDRFYIALRDICDVVEAEYDCPIC